MPTRAVQDAYVRGGTQRRTYQPSEVVAWPCPLCGAERHRLLASERGALGIVRCEDCGLMRTSPRLEQPDEIYRGSIDVYREEFRFVVSGAAPHHRDPNYLQDLARIRARKPTGRWLDVGTNAGSFLRLARGQGWDLVGVEPSPPLARLAREWWGLEVMEGFVERLAIAPQSFDIVTMTDVFEHVVNPRDVLAAIRRAMRPDGLLFVKVPNGLFSLLKHTLRARLGRTGQDDFDAYEHVCHYTEDTLRRMITSAGFDVLDVWVETPVQIPTWHQRLGHYYQHASPYAWGWKTHLARDLLFRAARIEAMLTRRVGWLAPNVGCFAQPAAPQA